MFYFIFFLLSHQDISLRLSSYIVLSSMTIFHRHRSPDLIDDHSLIVFSRLSHPQAATSQDIDFPPSGFANLFWNGGFVGFDRRWSILARRICEFRWWSYKRMVVVSGPDEIWTASEKTDGLATMMTAWTEDDGGKKMVGGW